MLSEKRYESICQTWNAATTGEECVYHFLDARAMHLSVYDEAGDLKMFGSCMSCGSRVFAVKQI